MLRYLILFIPLLYACNSPATASQYPKQQLAHVEIAKFQHTKHVQKQQKDICQRLKKIHKKLEKQKEKQG
tara:strand:- start:320 stop:529 length:210 start_codon:yes stop_codon:yes gene_type:complete